MFEPHVTLYSRTGEVKVIRPASRQLEAIVAPRPRPTLLSERNAADLAGVLTVFAIFAAILVR